MIPAPGLGGPAVITLFPLQRGMELERTLLGNQLTARYGEELREEPRRMATLVNTLEFFYTRLPNDGARLVTKQVNEG